MEILDLGPLTDRQRSQLEGDERDPFDSAGVTLQFRRKSRHVAICEDGRLIASAGLTSAEVAVDGERFDVVGLGGVIVSAAHRRQGLARRVVEEALVRARAMGPSFAILFCHADRVGLYDRVGFHEITSEVVVEQPEGFEPIILRTMWCALEPGAAWPPGAVTVHGLPF